jgi:unsaturated rhamnogalacturonyl hydrolase
MSCARLMLVAALALAPLACGGGATPGGTPGTAGGGSAGGAGAAGATGTAGSTAGTAGASGASGAAGTTGGGGAGTTGAAGSGSGGGGTGVDASTSDGAVDAHPTSDAATDAGAPALNAGVVSLMRRVADFDLKAPGAEKDWIHGAMWTGIMATYQITGDAKYLAAIKTWAGVGWTLTNGAASRGDDQCAAQTYFDAYLSSPSAANMVMLAGAKPSFDALVAKPPVGRVEWWWEDALFMVPPGFVRLGAATGDKTYFTVMGGMWWDTYAFLWDAKAGLMYRDDMHRNEFWGRGNGWVIAGTARVLQYLPADDAKRGGYVTMLTAMSAALKAAQGTDGMWRSNLLVPTQFPNQETSATGLITYAIAWGINNGVLDRASYLPVVQKAWTGLVSVIDTNGMVGWCQPVGAGPAAATATSTTPFGVGAWLLAASEMAKLVP